MAAPPVTISRQYEQKSLACWVIAPFASSLMRSSPSSLFTCRAPDGKARCAGGDYYEADIVGDLWKSRSELTDLDDGTCEVIILVDSQKSPGLSLQTYMT
ncbi:hypothetical protein L7F22_048415 [Adiantum nelumboides]|nr:hypothetical protein [Adiantum nelumboides]